MEMNQQQHAIQRARRDRRFADLPKQDLFRLFGITEDRRKGDRRQQNKQVLQ